MPLELVTIPCLSDNYAFLIHDAATGQTALVDAPEAAPIQRALSDRGWSLTDILLTHHHPDHVDGVAALRDGTRVIGAAADAHRLPPLDLAVAEGDRFVTCGAEVDVIDVSGHTIGHIAFHIASDQLLFSGDSLMAGGCGRLFEGTPAQMWKSLQKLRGFGGATRVCSGHEYTATNMRFALSLEPDNPRLISRAEAVSRARDAGAFTVPSELDLERNTNPFLRADDPALAKALGLSGAEPVDVFAETRSRRDTF